MPKKGRQFDAGRATFEGYIQQNLAGKIVVFALGTNGLVTDDQIDAIMADAGDKRIVVFVNTRSPQPWVGSTNQAIANAATRYKNVRVIDWYGYSANRNDLFDGDGTHLSTTGVTEYLNLIHDAVKKDLPVHPEDHVNDPQPAAVKSATDALVNALASQAAQAGHRQVTRSKQPKITLFEPTQEVVGKKNRPQPIAAACSKQKEALSAVAHRLQHKHDDRQHRNHADSRPSEHVPYAAVAVGAHNVTVGGDNHLKHQNHGSSTPLMTCEVIMIWNRSTPE